MSPFLETFRRHRHTLIPLPWKYGREFRRLFRFLNEHQHCSREELADFQWRHLKLLLAYAYEHVPYYRESFAAIGLHPGDIATPGHFRQIPILRKDEVAANIEKLKSDQFDKLKPLQTTTSATTRDSLTTYRSQLVERYRLATVWRHYHNLGYHFRDPRAQLTVQLRFLSDPLEMPVDYNENCLLLDTRALRYEHCQRIHERLQAFQPRMLFCQPSNVVCLIEFFRQRGLPPIEIPIIYSLGEKVYPEYRQAIESFFGGTLVQYYGNRENTASASQLADGRFYVNSEYCCLEVLPPDGRPARGVPGDIISTSLHNYAFPLIRYDTEDLGICCGHPDDALRNYQTIEIVGGRGKDLLLTREGLLAPSVSRTTDSVCAGKYKRVQLEQLSMDELVVRLIPLPGFCPQRDCALLEKAWSDLFPGQFKVSVELVENIDRTDSGKYKMVISEPAMNYLRHTLDRPGRGPA
jgi:phenylacetate-CoA ligase